MEQLILHSTHLAWWEFEMKEGVPKQIQPSKYHTTNLKNYKNPGLISFKFYLSEEHNQYTVFFRSRSQSLTLADLCNKDVEVYSIQMMWQISILESNI